MSCLPTSVATQSDPAAAEPLVTAVIPTRNRPELVIRAVRSALGQTYQRMEVVVVIDGPDAATEVALAEIQDDRLRVLRLPLSVGGSDARNAGVQAAQGEWIALLDDDDEWLCQKIELQMRRASSSNVDFPIISSRIIARTPQADYVWPRRLLRTTEPVAEYLFCRESLWRGRGLIQTSTILTKRTLLRSVPFRPGLRKHQDWDWIIRAARVSGVEVTVWPETLAIWHVDPGRAHLSKSNDWLFSLTWIRSRRDDVTRRAYAAFVLIVVAEQLAASCTLKEYFGLFTEALKSGSPSLPEVTSFMVTGLVPLDLRRRLQAVYRGAFQ